MYDAAVQNTYANRTRCIPEPTLTRTGDIARRKMKCQRLHASNFELPFWPLRFLLLLICILGDILSCGSTAGPQHIHHRVSKGRGGKEVQGLGRFIDQYSCCRRGGLKRGLKGDKAVLIMPPLPPRSSGADREQMHHLGPRGKRATQ